MSTLVGGAAPQRPILRSPEVKAFLYENAIIGETARFRRLDRYQAHYLGLQYQHQKHDWWGYPADNMETVSPDILVPFGFSQPALALTVRQKRPTAPYGLCQAIVDRFTGLLFSDTRRPSVFVENDPDTEDFLLAAMEQMRWWPKWREARTMGGALGSVLVTAHLRQGELGAKFTMEVHNPKHLQIVWRDRRTLVPAAVLKCYKYPVEEDDFDERTREYKGTKLVEYLYRRIITEEDDTVYKPVKIEPGVSLDWIEESRVEHGLGFFPGVWVQNLPVIEDVDGVPDCHGTWQSLDTVDRLLSQMNKGALLNLDPTLVVGVDPKVVEIQGGIRKGSDNALMVGQGGSAQYLEVGGGGTEVGLRLVERFEKNVLTVARCVLVDAEKISGAAQSAKAIEYIYAPMLEKADDLRAQYGDMGIVPLLNVVERMARRFYGKSAQMPDGGVGRYEFDLPPRAVVDPLPEGAPADAEPERATIPRKLGPGGHIRIQWGPYFAPTEHDKQQAINNVTAAKSGGLIDEETAVAQIAPTFGIRDARAVLRKVRSEREAEMEMALGGLESGVPATGGGERVTFFQYEIEGGLVTINEVRRSKGLPPIKDGELTLPQLRAKYPSTFAVSAAAQTSSLGEKILGMEEDEGAAPPQSAPKPEGEEEP